MINIITLIKNWKVYKPFYKRYGIKWIFNKKYRHKCKEKRKRKKYGSGYRSSVKNKRIRLIQRDGGRCKICRRSDIPLTVDHIIKRSEGGSNLLHNLQLLCEPCHMIKDGPGNKPFADLRKLLK